MWIAQLRGVEDFCGVMGMTKSEFVTKLFLTIASTRKTAFMFSLVKTFSIGPAAKIFAPLRRRIELQ